MKRSRDAVAKNIILTSIFLPIKKRKRILFIFMNGLLMVCNLFCPHPGRRE